MNDAQGKTPPVAAIQGNEQVRGKGAAGVDGKLAGAERNRTGISEIGFEPAAVMSKILMNRSTISASFMMTL